MYRIDGTRWGEARSDAGVGDGWRAWDRAATLMLGFISYEHELPRCTPVHAVGQLAG